MKPSILLLLLLVSPLLARQSSRTEPFKTNEQVQFTAPAPSFQISQYFSLDGIPEHLKNKEWYIFVSLKLPEQSFSEKYEYTFQTVSKDKDVESDVKVQCERVGNHFSDCFIGSSQVNPEKDVLKIKLLFFKEMKGTMKLQIYGVRTTKVGYPIVLQKSKQDYSRIVRMDISDYTQKFQYLVCSLQKEIIRPDEQYFYFLASKEQTPPMFGRMRGFSYSLLGKGKQIFFSYSQLEQVDVLTFSFQLFDNVPYDFVCKSTNNMGKPKELIPGKTYHDAFEDQATYTATLPSRSSDIWYVVYMKQLLGRTAMKSAIYLNGKALTPQEFQQMMQRTQVVVMGEMQFWLNSTINEFKMVLAPDDKSNLKFIQISVEKYDIKLIELKEQKLWLDSLEAHQLQYLFFTIDSKNPDTPLTFDVGMDGNDQLSPSFMYCSETTIQKCKEDIYKKKNDEAAKVGLYPLKPKLYPYPNKWFYQFKNIKISSVGLDNGLSRSIIIVNMTSHNRTMRYSIFWIMGKPVKKLEQGKMQRGLLEKGHSQVFQFQTLEVKNTSFARVDYFVEGLIQVYGSETLSDFTNMDQQKGKKIYQSYDRAIVFPQLKSFTKYYVYFKDAIYNMNYKAQLSFGYNYDAFQNHPISNLKIGQNSKNTLTLQPGQILILEVQLQDWTIITYQTNQIMKICVFEQVVPPKSHQEILNNPTCSNFRTRKSMIKKNKQNPKLVDYAAIQNERKVPITVTITTQNQQDTWCIRATMGQRQSTFLSNTTKKGCASYQITHKAEIEVLTDVDLPQLKGISHPTIHIGKQYSITLTKTSYIFSQEQIDGACSQDYDQCFMRIQYQLQSSSQNHTITIFAGYTDHPLLLLDGISQTAVIKDEHKERRFKYPLTQLNRVTVSLKKQYWETFQIYARITTIDEKFQYPNEQIYLDSLKKDSKLPTIYTSKEKPYVQHLYFNVSEKDLKQQCKYADQCYILITVVCTRHDKGIFSIQASQKFHELRIGELQKNYQEKDDIEYFTVNNEKKGGYLLVLVSSHGEVCHKISMSKGFNPFKEMKRQRKTDELIEANATQGYYTIAVEATEDCFYSIEVLNSHKAFSTLNSYYGAPIYLNPSQKRYYLIRHNEQAFMKIISSIHKNNQGQIIMRLMPIKEEQISTFVKYMNGQIKLGRKSNLQFVWTDRNHILITEQDKKFCKNCLYFLEVEAVQRVTGYISLATEQFQAMSISYESVIYDILRKDEHMIWLFHYRRNQHDFEFNIQSGSIQIQLFQDDKMVNSYNLTYDDQNIDKNSHFIKGQNKRKGKYIKTRVTALEDSDYSMELMRNQSGRFRPYGNNDSADVHYPAPMGRPLTFRLTDQHFFCFNGSISNNHQEYVLTIKNPERRKKDRQSDETVAKKIYKSLIVNSSINDIWNEMDKSLNKNMILLNFTDTNLSSFYNYFDVCLKLQKKIPHIATFLYMTNLNYLPENQPIHLRGSKNITFTSQQSMGVIDIDECSSRAIIHLSPDYRGINSTYSTIKQRRQGNNIFFEHKGPVYLGFQSADYVTLRWRNRHRENGYQNINTMYEGSKFDIYQKNKDTSIMIAIQPLKKKSSKPLFGTIRQINYQIFFANNEADIYSAMNCLKGTFLEWQVRQYQSFDRPVEHYLITRSDIMNYMKLQKIFVIVKAEILLDWNNDREVESFRVYYPYQELVINPLTNPQKPDQKSNIIVELLMALVVLLVAIIVFLSGFKCYKKYYRVPGRLVEEDLPTAYQNNSGSVEMKNSFDYHKA